MSTVIKQCVGIDCAKDELVCCLSFLYQDLEVRNIDIKAFVNSKTGFTNLLKWVKKHTDSTLELMYVVEATGVYHEELAYYLSDLSFPICIVLPSKIKHFRRSMEIKTDNDKTASIGIAEFGLLKKLEPWKRPSPVLRKIREILRERTQLSSACTSSKNQLHAVQHGVMQSTRTEKRIKDRIKFLEKQIAEIEKEVEELLLNEAWLKAKVDKICSIKGIGIITALTIIAETDGFALIRNKRQLVSYSGLDVVEKSSGISVRGRSRISKRGNSQIRRALYFPALSAVMHNPGLKEDYARIVSKTSIKMKGLVAIERKLLVLIYTLWKNDERYDPELYKKSGRPKMTDPNELDKSALEVQN